MAVSIQGQDEVKAALEKAAQIGQSGGPLEQAAAFVARRAHYYMRSITHVDTSALKASHAIEQRGRMTILYQHPAVINPRSRKRPAEYGFYENRRGGQHAFYDRTMEKIPLYMELADSILRKALP